MPFSESGPRRVPVSKNRPHQRQSAHVCGKDSEKRISRFKSRKARMLSGNVIPCLPEQLKRPFIVIFLYEDIISIVSGYGKYADVIISKYP